MVNVRLPPLALAAIGYTALAIVLTFPLILHLSTTLPRDLGDPLLSTSILWWNAHAVPFTDRWWNGFAFYPAPGTLAFSDPRLGSSLMATPLQWIGLNPAAAYNITFLATYPLCALAAHWLGFVLTARHGASTVAGLVFGFCPFRAAHMPHLELLAAFGMPCALAALHLFLRTKRRKWLAVFALALVVQGLCSSYYLLFFSVFLAVWLLWFFRPDDWRSHLEIVIAGAIAGVVMLPLVLGYGAIHRFYGFERSFDEIQSFSADVTSFFVSHATLLLWGWTAPWSKSEGELFPGATVLVLVAIGAVLRWKASDRPPRRWRSVIVALAGVCAATAIAGWAFGPWRLTVPGLTMDSSAPFKPMSIAAMLLLLWLVTSVQFLRAYRARSLFAFYLLAAGVLLVCSLGPKPTFAGRQFLYEPPYAWLMRTPAFASIRVPARFAMPATLALAMAGALVAARLGAALTPRKARIVTTLLIVGAAADGWTWPLTLPTLPPTWAAGRAQGHSSVIELPFGDPVRDFAAMFRATVHGRPVVNGSSGFEPAHYAALRVALNERDPAALDWAPPDAPLLIALDTEAEDASSLETFVQGLTAAKPLARESRWAFYSLRPPPSDPVACGDRSLALRSVSYNGDPIETTLVTDQNQSTRWYSPEAQRQDDAIVVDLGGVQRPCGLRLDLSSAAATGYPRHLVVETSNDRSAWVRVASARTASLAVAGALRAPREVPIRVTWKGSEARYVQLKLEESHKDIPWVFSELAVLRDDSADAAARAHVR